MKIWVQGCLVSGLLAAGCSKSGEDQAKELGRDAGDASPPTPTNTAPSLPPEKRHEVKLISAPGQPGFNKHPVLQMYEYQDKALALRIAFKADPFSQPNVAEAIVQQFDYCTMTLKFPGRAGEGKVADASLAGFLRVSGQSKDFENYKGLKLTFASHRPGRLGGKLEGTVTAISERPSTAVGSVADAADPDEKVTKVNLPFVVDFDLALAGSTPTSPPIVPRLSPATVTAALGAQVGQWSVQGQSTPVGAAPSRIAFDMDIRWAEKGKSIVTSCTITQSGKQIKLTGQRSFDPKQGVFVYRQTAEGLPEMISHERYHESTRTFHGIPVAPPLPQGIRVTYTHQIDNPNLIRFRLNTFQGAQLIKTEEQTYTRKIADTGKPKSP